MHARAAARAKASFPAGGLAAELPAGPATRLSIWLAWVITRTAASLLFRLRVENAPRIDGAFVLVANHASFLDPLLLAVGTRRRVTFLMTVLHYRSVRLGWFFRWSRAIPLAVRGAGNRGALRAARAVLRRGEVLGVFPEGGLTRDGELLLGSPGAVSLVLSEDVPIVPVYLDGAFGVLPIGGPLRLFRRVTVRFGAPVSRAELVAGADDRREQLRIATERVMEQIARLGAKESRERWLANHGVGAST